MAELVTGFLKLAFGILMNKLRDKAAAGLSKGDLTDQEFRNVIVRELDDVKLKLDGIARAALLTSVSFFSEGVAILGEVLNKRRSDETPQLVRPSTESEMVLQAEEAVTCRSVQNVMTESNTNSVCTAANFLSFAWDLEGREAEKIEARFKAAREKATEAFNNEALSTADRVLAMKFRVMSTLLESLQSPCQALASCRVCIRELHALPVVREAFGVHFSKGVRSWFKKEERHGIICSVAQINWLVYKFDCMVLEPEEKYQLVFDWPEIATDKRCVHPICDSGIKMLIADVNPSFLEDSWSFGHEGTNREKLHYPQDVTVNSEGQFIVADTWGGSAKVYSKRGTYLMSLCPPSDAQHVSGTGFKPTSVAVDSRDNVYAASGKVPWSRTGVYVFDKTGSFSHKFAGYEEPYSIAVNENNKVFVKLDWKINVYNTSGHLLSSAFDRSQCGVKGVVANLGSGGRVLSLDSLTNSIRVLDERGRRVTTIKIQGFLSSYSGIAFNKLSGELVCYTERRAANEELMGGQLEVFTQDGEPLHILPLDREKFHESRALSITADGRVCIAVANVGKKAMNPAVHVL